MKIINPQVSLGPGSLSAARVISGRKMGFTVQWVLRIRSGDDLYAVSCLVENSPFPQKEANHKWWTNSYVIEVSDINRLLDIKNDPELAAELKNIFEAVLRGEHEVNAPWGIRLPEKSEIDEIVGNLLPRWKLIVEHSEQGQTEGRLIEKNFGEDLPQVPKA